MKNIRHPAKYTDSFIPMFAEMLKGCKNVLDPFAGTGKIGLVKQYGFDGSVYANDMEREWLEPNEYGCDWLSYCDAEKLVFPEAFFDAVCTSPTYGNRMADHHIAKDASRRNTYTHCLGHQLHDGNTGKMQWGEEYRRKHLNVYKHLAPMIKPGGIFILNVKNHIRKGVEIDVKGFHEEILSSLGFLKEKEVFVETQGNGFGKNGRSRTKGEYILIFRKELQI